MSLRSLELAIELCGVVLRERLKAVSCVREKYSQQDWIGVAKADKIGGNVAAALRL